MQLFKSNRVDIFKPGMSPDAVIVALHKLEEGFGQTSPHLKEREINALILEGSEERLHCGTVPTVPLRLVLTMMPPSAS